MGNVNMEADQIHVRDNSHKSWRTVADALKALETSGESVAEDITELYTRDASRASKEDIANEFDAELSYFAGDYVYYEGTLFKFVANHSGDWDPADVVIAQIGDAIADISAAVDYSTTEQPTGQKWLDGKEIYFKTYEIAALPNSTTTRTPTGLSNLDKVVKIEGMAYGNSTHNPLPFVSTSAQYSIECWVDDNANIVLTSSANYSAYNGVVTLYYTKTA